MGVQVPLWALSRLPKGSLFYCGAMIEPNADPFAHLEVIHALSPLTAV
jgi:hypothetical protein